MSQAVDDQVATPMQGCEFGNQQNGGMAARELREHGGCLAAKEEHGVPS